MNDRNLPELESEYLKSRHLSHTGKTHKWAIDNRRFASRLATVYWHTGWRQYIFVPEPDCIFSWGCLGDVREFLLRANAHRKAERANEQPTSTT